MKKDEEQYALHRSWLHIFTWLLGHHLSPILLSRDILNWPFFSFF